MSKEIFSRILDYKTGLTGSTALSASTTKYGAYQGFVCQDYTIVEIIRNSYGNDVTTELGVGGVLISPGIYISMPKGECISSIRLISGSVILYDLASDIINTPTDNIPPFNATQWQLINFAPWNNITDTWN